MSAFSDCELEGNRSDKVGNVASEGKESVAKSRVCHRQRLTPRVTSRRENNDRHSTNT